MYYAIQNYVLEDSIISSSEKLLLALISQFAKAGRSAYASVKTLCQKLSVTRRTLFRHIASLEQKKYIKKIKLRKVRHLIVHPDCPHYEHGKHTTEEQLKMNDENMVKVYPNKPICKIEKESIDVFKSLIENKKEPEKKEKKDFVFRPWKRRTVDKSPPNPNNKQESYPQIGDTNDTFNKTTPYKYINKEKKNNSAPPIAVIVSFFSRLIFKGRKSIDKKQINEYKFYMQMIIRRAEKNGLVLDSEKINQIIFSIYEKRLKDDNADFLYIINGAIKMMKDNKWKTPFNYTSEALDTMTSNEQKYIKEHERLKKEEIEMCRSNEINKEIKTSVKFGSTRLSDALRYKPKGNLYY